MPKKEFECSICFNDDPINFYPYLKSKCKNCKRKKSREFKSLKSEVHQKLDELDPDCKIRNVVDELLTKDKVFEGKSLLNFISDIKFDISEENMSSKIKINHIFELLDKIQDKIIIRFDVVNDKINSLRKDFETLQSIVNIQNKKVEELEEIISLIKKS